MDPIVDADGRWILDGWIGTLKITTPEPLSEDVAREYARLLGIEVPSWM